MEHQPWVEKYRPRCVREVVHREALGSVLRGMEETGDIPHLLFHGPPGTGKTSTILALARSLFGEFRLKERVLELNASDERGLDVVRDKIKTFSKLSLSSHHDCPPYKLVILDEADTMTSGAQSALRRTMETFSSSTRFCLVCNYASKVIGPVASRCAKFLFSPLQVNMMRPRLLSICESEGVVFEGYSRDIFDAILRASGGDMRRSVNLLQLSSRIEGVTPECISEIAGEVPGRVLGDLWSTLTCKPSSFEAAVAATTSFVEEGYPVGSVLGKLAVLVTKSTQISDAGKSLICRRLPLAEARLNDGADEELQLLDVCCLIQEVFFSVIFTHISTT